MKKILIATIAILLSPVVLLAQSSKVFDDLSLPSKILKMDRKYAIYLPPDYEASKRSYPVLYLLHGSGDDQTGWVQFGEIQHFADKGIADGTATPMIIVMPDGNTGRRGYFNDIKGDWNYEDFFFQELIPYIEKNYRAKTDKRSRAISGLSMGGGGTFIYALHHPELFSSACPLSAAIGPITLEDARASVIRTLPNAADSVITKYYNRQSVMSLINNMPDAQKKAVRWFGEVGDDDALSDGNCLVHIAMRKKGIDHEFRVVDGAHTWTVWRGALPKVLSFVSDAFHQF